MGKKTLVTIISSDMEALWGLPPPKLPIAHEWVIGNQPWNKNMQYLEFYAAFVNPDLVGKKYMGFAKDPTEGRWGRIQPILRRYEYREINEYGFRYTSGGMDRQHIGTSITDKKLAEEKLLSMFNEIQTACGPEYPIRFEIGDINGESYIIISH